MPPPLLLLLLLSASFLRLPAPGGAACSPKACGDLSITYPFWLEEGAGRPPCGSPSFELKCNGTHAFLSRSILGQYQVARVFADNSSFVAVNHNLLPNAGCPPRWFNVSLGLGLGPYTISKKNMEVLVLYNCTDQQRAPPPGFSRTRCADGSFYRLGGVYGGHSGPGIVPPACSGLAVVPVLGFPDGEDYVPSMRQGFLLEWTVPSDDCPKCEASGGQCRYANDGTGFSCSCSGGVYPDKCGELRKTNRRQCQP